MAALKEKSVALLSTTTVAFNANADTVLYTVPTGKRCVLRHAVVVAGADAGITSAEWGIAETGTLVLACGPDQPRLASLLPPAHIAILRADRILPDLPAFFARCGALPSALTLVTGPSRSADIGFVPVLGAHGPMAVAVFVIAN